MSCLNESENIKTVLRDWDIVFKENEISYYILVNDGSKDDSLEVMKSLKYNIFLLDNITLDMEGASAWDMIFQLNTLNRIIYFKLTVMVNAILSISTSFGAIGKSMTSFKVLGNQEETDILEADLKASFATSILTSTTQKTLIHLTGFLKGL